MIVVAPKLHCIKIATKILKENLVEIYSQGNCPEVTSGLAHLNPDSKTISLRPLKGLAISHDLFINVLVQFG